MASELPLSRVHMEGWRRGDPHPWRLGESEVPLQIDGRQPYEKLDRRWRYGDPGGFALDGSPSASDQRPQPRGRTHTEITRVPERLSSTSARQATLPLDARKSEWRAGDTETFTLDGSIPAPGQYPSPPPGDRSQWRAGDASAFTFDGSVKESAPQHVLPPGERRSSWRTGDTNAFTLDGKPGYMPRLWSHLRATASTRTELGWKRVGHTSLPSMSNGVITVSCHLNAECQHQKDLRHINKILFHTL
eukprot:6191533-Pleurochrysis_carterae.AAC.7